MKALSRRLRRLEGQFAHAIAARRKSAVPPEPSPAAWIAQKLDHWGVVRGSNEGLAETTARALAWAPMQLRNYLQNRALGLK